MKRICVYCGSNSGNRAEYISAAKELGKEFVKRDISLIYGGARVGIMGAIADQVLALGGEVIGVMPQALIDKEVAHTQLSELIVVESMHQRKSKMEQLSDGFIALPGGLGTIEELFEMLTWAQLGLHNKPCAILNIASYFDPLCGFLEHAATEGFVKPSHAKMLLIKTNPIELLNAMDHYNPPKGDKWINKKL
jgi:hypothetical protein